MNIKLQPPEELFPLENVGSKSNYMFMHLCFYLGLHSHMINVEKTYNCLGITVFELRAASAAARAASLTPVPFKADVSIILQPSASLSFSVSILSPDFFSTSIIFSAMTTGLPSSRICVVKYKFRLMFVESTRFKTAAGSFPAR